MICSGPKLQRNPSISFVKCYFARAGGEVLFKAPQKGTWITQGSSKESNTADADTDLYGKISCYCKQPEFQKMMACDNPECPIKWFHYKCVGLNVPQSVDGFVQVAENFQKFTLRKGKANNA